MKTYVTTPPADTPISIEEAKESCRIYADDESEHELIERLINAAWKIAETLQQRTLMVRQMGLKIDYCFPCCIEIPKPPLISVQSIQYIDSAGIVQTLDPSEYDVDLYSTPGKIVPAYNRSWPSVLPKLNAVTVNYTAGSNEIPDETKTALCMIVGHLYENREAYSSEAFTFKEVPLGIKELLKQNRWCWY